MSVVKFKTNFRGHKVPNDTKIPRLIRSAKGLCDLGVLDGQSGNLSFRTKDGFIISCANVSLAHIKETEFTEVFNVYTVHTSGHNSAQIVVASGLTEPSSESPVHWIIYRLLPKVNAIFHIHDDKALELAEELGLPVTSSFQESGTFALMKEVEKLISVRRDLKYFLLKNHGAVVLGSSMEETFCRAETVRNRARKLVTPPERRTGVKKGKTAFVPEFEDTPAGNLKKNLWFASDEEVRNVLKQYDIPSPGEYEKMGSYIQMTHPREIEENLRHNDVVLIPLGATENHGPHSVYGQDNLQVSRLCEAVRRYTERKGRAVGLAQSPWLYGSHPAHHVGMIGTIPISAKTNRQILIDVMFGLWTMGYRKFIFVNNHAQHWVISQAQDDFSLRYPALPHFSHNYDWHSAVREFFRTKDRGGLSFETDFVHGDEAETSLLLLLAPEAVDMNRAVDTKVRGYLPDGHFNKSAAQRETPNTVWWSVRHNGPKEINAQPEGVVGKATLASAQKAERAVAASLQYLTLVIEDILKAFPPGATPPIKDVTLFDEEEVGGYLKRLGEPGYKNPYRLWRPFSD